MKRLKLTRTRSAAKLRAAVVEWLKSKGAEPSPHINDWRIYTRIGWLIVHLPYDAPCVHAHRVPGKRMTRIGLLSINTRFEDPTQALPPHANKYSGKWNFSCYESEERLLVDFKVLIGELLPAAISP